MKLWTWHKPDFSLLDGELDHEKSEYVRSMPVIRPAYRKLATRIGTCKFLWCDTLPDQRVVVSDYHTEVEWILDVPASAVLCYLDSIVWNRILGIRCGLGDERRRSWSEEQFELFWSQAAPTGDWWDELLVHSHTGEFVNALVPHPVHCDWVVENPR